MSADWAEGAAHEALEESTQQHLDSAQESAEAADQARAAAEQLRQNGR